MKIAKLSQSVLLSLVAACTFAGGVIAAEPPREMAKEFVKEPALPLAIAPDLVVESAETGQIVGPDGNDEKNWGKIKFVPTKLATGGGFGYRIKLKTTRKEVHVGNIFERFPATPQNKGALVHPVNGCIYCEFPFVYGCGDGKYWLRPYIEGVLLPTLRYTLQKGAHKSAGISTK